MQIIPGLQEWEELLILTQPEEWSGHSYYEMTKIFVSKTESEKTLIFFQKFLLEKCLKNIKKNKELDCHLYQ